MTLIRTLPCCQFRALPGAVLAGALSLLLHPAPALAQEAPLGFSAGPAESVEHDSNVLRVPAAGGTGPVQAETIFSTDLIGSFHQTYGREEVSASATVGRVDYEHLKQYNYTQQDLQAALQAGLPLTINAGLTLARSAQLARFSDLSSTARDVITSNQASLSIDFPVTSDWRGVLGGSGVQSRNSNTLLQAQDYNESQASAGIRYAPTTGNHVDLLARTAHALYPNAAAGSLINASFLERGVDLSVDWTFTGASHALGHAGYVRRRNQPLSYFDCTAYFLSFCLSGHDANLDRDFAGPAYDLTYLWQLTPATRLTLYGARQTGAAGDNSYLSAVTRTWRFTPSYQATAKLQFDASAEWTQRNYFSSVYEAIYGLAPGAGRLDHSHNLGLDASWAPRRWLQFSLGAHRESRSSTLTFWNYQDTITSLGVRAVFN